MHSDKQRNGELKKMLCKIIIYLNHFAVLKRNNDKRTNRDRILRSNKTKQRSVMKRQTDDKNIHIYESGLRTRGLLTLADVVVSHTLIKFDTKTS